MSDHLCNASKNDCTDPETEIPLMKHRHCFIDAVLLNALSAEFFDSSVPG